MTSCQFLSEKSLPRSRREPNFRMRPAKGPSVSQERSAAVEKRRQARQPGYGLGECQALLVLDEVEHVALGLAAEVL